MKKNWLPKLLAIILISFLTLFSFDVITSTSSIFEIIVGFTIHSIPSLILLVALIVAWWKPRIGAVMFTLLGAIALIWLKGSFGIFGAIVLFIIGSLFFLGQKKPERA